MYPRKILNDFHEKRDRGLKSIALLIDPDKVTAINVLKEIIETAIACQVDFIFVGGSLISEGDLSLTVETIKSHCNIPVVIFPGDNTQICAAADALLLLSLVSGRNADLLIGQHVTAAPILKKSKLEIISTGYMLIDAKNTTTVSYMSNSAPIPADKPVIASCTAMAAEMIGMKAIYLEAGSGAEFPVPEKVIRSVKKNTTIPLIVGGGLNTKKKVENALKAGADIIVIGTAFEKNSSFLYDVAEVLKNQNLKDAY